jgi:NTP pyrophosphatase (non-canonical NTP hydrolase)
MPDGESLSACAYEPRCEATKSLAAIAGKSFGRRKVERRIKITHAEVQEASRLLNKDKQAAKAKQEIADIMARCEDLSIYVPEEDAADLTKDERSQALRWLHCDYWRRIPMPAGLSRVKGQ